MNYKELEAALANARPASFAPPAPAQAAPALSARDVALIKGLAPAIHEYVKQEIAAALAPLKADIEKVKSLVATSRPPVAASDGDHADARGPHISQWRQ
jgi:hypothetical protein